MQKRLFVLMMLVTGLTLALVRPAAAATDDEVRGGWIADADGHRYIYVLNIRNGGVRGIFCWDCSNPNNLAFVESGKNGPGELTFTVLHDVGPGAPWRETVTAKLIGGRLMVTRKGSHNEGPAEMSMTREPRRPNNAAQIPADQLADAATAGGPSAGVAAAAAAAPPPPAVAPPAPAGPGAPGAAPGGAPGGVPGRGPGAGGLPPGGRGGRAAYVPPGPNEEITAVKISGVWFSGNGPNKQYWMFRQVGDEIRGLVCGPCDNPYTFGALDHGKIMGDTFEYDIVHEDWGLGPMPFNNHVTATVARNEMHMRMQQDNMPPTPNPFEMTSTGPVSIDRMK